MKIWALCCCTPQVHLSFTVCILQVDHVLYGAAQWRERERAKGKGRHKKNSRSRCMRDSKHTAACVGDRRGPCKSKSCKQNIIKKNMFHRIPSAASSILKMKSLLPIISHIHMRMLSCRYAYIWYRLYGLWLLIIRFISFPRGTVYRLPEAV